MRMSRKPAIYAAPAIPLSLVLGIHLSGAYSLHRRSNAIHRPDILLTVKMQQCRRLHHIVSSPGDFKSGHNAIQP
jgi:hypothetical protein